MPNKQIINYMKYLIIFLFAAVAAFAEDKTLTVAPGETVTVLGRSLLPSRAAIMASDVTPIRWESIPLSDLIRAMEILERYAPRDEMFGTPATASITALSYLCLTTRLGKLKSDADAKQAEYDHAKKEQDEVDWARSVLRRLKSCTHG